MVEQRKLVIIGSGPSGYSAAVYTARAELSPLVLAGEVHGGQLMNTTLVENWPGSREGIMGPQLMMEMRAQAERFGAEIRDKFVSAVDFRTRPFKIWTQSPQGQSIVDLAARASDAELAQALLDIKQQSHEIEAEAVILATGAVPMLLGIQGETEFMGRGVGVCAVCDAAFYRGKRVVLVGGGDAAMEDALALSKFASKLTILVRKDSLRASKIMQKRVLEDHRETVSVMWNTEALEVLHDESKVTGVKIKNSKTGEEQTLATDGFFLAIGHKPATRFLQQEVLLDSKGYVVTRLGLHDLSVALAQKHLSEDGILLFPTMTSVEGVFAGGDNVDFRYRQAVTASGYGVMAALDAERWLEHV